MSSDNVLLETGALVVANFGILIGTVCLPFAASFLLDGIVRILRGDGPKLFLRVLALVVVLAVGGYSLWQFGISYPRVDLEGPALSGSVALYLVAVATVLALVGFVLRTVKLLRRARREADRLQYMQLSPQFRRIGSEPGVVPGDGRQANPVSGEGSSAEDPWLTHPSQ